MHRVFASKNDKLRLGGDKMKRIVRLFLITLVVCISVFSTSIFAESDQVINWYCTRNPNHKQPTLGTDLQIIEKYHGYYVDRNHGDDCNEKVIYLTFDAGYENGNIEKILNTLHDEQVPGAFFILENLIDKNPDLIRRMVDEGHTVCNHTASHRDMTKVDRLEDFRNELEGLEQKYKSLTGNEMSKLYRPPEGRFDERSLAFADQLGYSTIFWSFAYADWDNNRQPSAEYATKKIMDNLHNGAVILLHPTSTTNAEILGDVIRQIKREGYRFASLEEFTKS